MSTKAITKATASHLNSADRITPKTVLGTFGKAVKGSVSLSLSASGSEYCDDSCGAKNNGCYAQAIERLYVSTLTPKLIRHSLSIFKTLRMALSAVQGKTFPWFRFSVDGGLPMPEHFATRKQWKQFRKMMRQLVKAINAPIHLPVESYRKAKAYRNMLGDLVVIRRTCQSERSALQANDTRAVRIGKTSNPHHHNENKRMAKEFAQRIRDNGQTAIVCPAVIRDSNCGRCTACSDARVDVIVYPLHS